MAERYLNSFLLRVGSFFFIVSVLPIMHFMLCMHIREQSCSILLQTFFLL